MMEKLLTPTDSAYISRLRADYPERCAGQSDEEVMAYYNPSRHKYVESTLWDHLGDAVYDFEQVAAALAASEARLRQAEELLRRCRNDPGTVFTDLDARTYMQLVDDVDAFLAASEPRQGDDK